MTPLLIASVAILLTVLVCWLIITLPLGRRLDALARDLEAVRKALRRTEPRDEAGGLAVVAPRLEDGLASARPRTRPVDPGVGASASAARAIGFGPDGATLSLSAFDPDDPGQMLVALAGPDEESFMVLPTFEYLESFRVAFSAPVQNPAIVRHLFELDQDDGGGLRLLEPALVRIDEAGAPRRSRAGRMGGYSSHV